MFFLMIMINYKNHDQLYAIKQSKDLGYKINFSTAQYMSKIDHSMNHKPKSAIRHPISANCHPPYFLASFFHTNP